MKQASRSTQARINIAIDGPAGAGKSTVARHVARELSYVYIDTGAMYRAVALHMNRRGISPDEPERATEEMKQLQVELIPGDDRQSILLNGEDVTELIRTPEVSLQASKFAQIALIRETLVHMQRQLAERKGTVMDGRDIGTHVLPHAEQKWFLTATVEERARRRYVEWQGKEQITMEQLIKDIAERDHQDATRAISPLKQADDAMLLDTTYMSIDEIVQRMVKQANSILDGE
ncbi:(d)CMP kinase [Paenibacillus agilis]|uniref:Cytidylate kinase n=1 Tax=Paenibacillus agilis TaxID=3020863 RepID=A0A559IZ11_9BACL|nr:(d)CMP kinase [Paenibacillus agilis]TVX92864.1 (d)CMP kinase [Paenibacillus agilis]